jgi:hypothetical protein
MAAKEGEFYYNNSGGTIGEGQIDGLRIEGKGTTKDGFQIHHVTYFRNGNHISYDTVKVNGEYHYILGSGHTHYHGKREPERWDLGKQQIWSDAQQKYARDLVKYF